MNPLDMFRNAPLMAAGLAWALAQIIKVPLDYLYTRELN